MVAFYLMALRHRLDRAHKASHRQTNAVKHGKAFLRSLAAEQKQIEWSIACASQGRPAIPWLREQQETLGRIDEAQNQISLLLPALSFDVDPDYEPIRLIAARAQEAWRETNGGRAPRSANAKDPLCRFVVMALTAIGEVRSAAEVAEVLRGRRRKPKDGQKP
jgi:hypothetical protein